MIFVHKFSVTFLFNNFLKVFDSFCVEKKNLKEKPCLFLLLILKQEYCTKPSGRIISAFFYWLRDLFSSSFKKKIFHAYFWTAQNAKRLKRKYCSSFYRKPFFGCFFFLAFQCVCRRAKSLIEDLFYSALMS